jgi:hypothetical protein
MQVECSGKQLNLKVLLTIAFLFFGFAVFSQADSLALKNRMQLLDKALIEKDSTALLSVLHKNVSYGHSNGWVQTRSDVLNDFKSEKLIYSKIENSAARIVAINKKQAIVRTSTHAEGLLNKNPFNLDMHVLQVWIKTKRGWQLMARQSVKLN